MQATATIDTRAPGTLTQPATPSRAPAAPHHAAPKPTAHATARTASGTDASGRYDIYSNIHKALRLYLSDTMCLVGRTDPADDAAVEATLRRLGEMVDVCALHVHDEETFLHPALQSAMPGSSDRIAGEHEEHREAFDALRELGEVVRVTRGPARTAALDRLYHALAAFLADNLMHMEIEQTAHNEVLWAHYSDGDLHAIEGALVASLPPASALLILRWMLPAMNAAERAAMFRGMQATMPPEALLGLLEVAREVLKAPDHAALARAVGAPPVPGLVTV